MFRNPLKIPENFRNARVLVVGDVMLDRYWFGEVDRISPEAPVPIVKVDRTDERLGGAANVARNVTAIGASATLLSVVGADDAARAVRRLLEIDSICPVLHVDDTITTTVKLRILGRQQQLVRADFESKPDRDLLLDMLSVFDQLLDSHDIVVLSDYGKGGLTHIREMIKRARTQNKPVVIDPKGDDYDRYRGATVITPNRAELRAVVGDWKDEDDLKYHVKKLMQQIDIQSVLLTRSEEGMSLFLPDETHDEPTLAQEVFDVTGAGDTVIGVFATALAAGFDIVTAMRLANVAAGVVVGKLGTAVANLDEIREKAFDHQE